MIGRHGVPAYLGRCGLRDQPSLHVVVCVVVVFLLLLLLVYISLASPWAVSIYNL